MDLGSVYDAWVCGVAYFVRVVLPMELARRQIVGSQEREFSVSPRNTGGSGGRADISSQSCRESLSLGFQYLPLHRAARMADRRPLLAIARARAANGRALAQASAAARGDPVTLQGDVQDVQQEFGAGAVRGLPNAERFTGRRGVWAVAAAIATVVRTSPTANSMLAALAWFRPTSIPDAQPEQGFPIGPPVYTAPRAGC